MVRWAREADKGIRKSLQAREGELEGRESVEEPLQIQVLDFREIQTREKGIIDGYMSGTTVGGGRVVCHTVLAQQWFDFGNWHQQGGVERFIAEGSHLELLTNICEIDLVGKGMDHRFNRFNRGF